MYPTRCQRAWIYQERNINGTIINEKESSSSDTGVLHCYRKFGSLPRFFEKEAKVRWRFDAAMEATTLDGKAYDHR